jgi:hypothetical protein
MAPLPGSSWGIRREIWSRPEAASVRKELKVTLKNKFCTATRKKCEKYEEHCGEHCGEHWSLAFHDKLHQTSIIMSECLKKKIYQPC